MNTHEQEVKKDIVKRLRLSNKKKWRALSPEQQQRMVDKYYEIRDQDYLSLRNILREYAELRRDFGLLISGVVLGVVTNVIASIFLKYLPVSDTLGDGLIAVVFILGIVLFIKAVERTLAKNLDDEGVIDKLIAMTEEKPSE